MANSMQRSALVAMLFFLAWLAPVSSAMATNEVFLSTDTAESEVTYVIQFDTAVKGHLDKIRITLPPGTNAANAALGRLIIGDKDFEGDNDHKKDVQLSVDGDTLIIDLRDERNVKVGTKILVELFNLNNPVAGNHAIDVTTKDKKGNPLDMLMIAYSIFATGAGDITAVNTPAGSGLTGGAASGEVTLSVDTNVIQRRVTGSCAEGSSIRVIDPNGVVTCQPDNNSGGTITGVTADTGLTGSGTTGNITLSIIGPYQLPQRCPANQIAKWNGSVWTCANDNDTTYTAGTGLTLNGTAFTLDQTFTDNRYVNVTGDTMSGALTVTGSLSGNTVSGDGSGLTNLNAGNLASGTLPGGRLAGIYGNDLTFNNPLNSFTGAFSGNGSGLTSLNAGNLASGAVPDTRLSGTYSNALTLSNTANSYTGNQASLLTLCLSGDCRAAWPAGGGSGWSLTGNTGTNPTTNFVGTTDGTAFEVRVNDQRALRIEPGSSPNVIGGFGGNSVTAGVLGATISGGGSIGSSVNRVTSSFGTVGGGNRNTASGLASIVGGGVVNTASGVGATVPGGESNSAVGDYSFAAGRRANIDAAHDGAFLWADSTNLNFSSAAANEFAARSTGGVRFVTAVDATGAPTAGVSLASGGTSWSVISDRNTKQNFKLLDGEEILEKISRLSVMSWNYKHEGNGAVPHWGPVAQDFKALFYPGRDDKTISTLEFDGVEMASIVALEKRTSEQKAEINALRAENSDLKARLERLERMIMSKEALAQK